jgi:hypothetical protein
LLSSGYIAGGAIAAVLISFMNFYPDLLRMIDFSEAPAADGSKAVSLVAGWIPEAWFQSPYPSLVAFGVLAVVLLAVGMFKGKPSVRTN